MRSDQAAGVLPGAPSEIVHRDRFVLAGSDGYVR
jgi:hypothetical protein